MDALQQRREIDLRLESGKTESETRGTDLDLAKLLRRRPGQSLEILWSYGQIEVGTEAHHDIAEIAVIAGGRGEGIGRAAPSGASCHPVEILTRDHAPPRLPSQKRTNNNNHVEQTDEVRYYSGPMGM